MAKGTQGKWKVRKDDIEAVPKVVATELGRFRDESRTVATMRDNSILSHEDAELIVEAIEFFRHHGGSDD